MPNKICNGVGAKATVLKNSLYPKKFIGDRYANIGSQERINDLVVVRKGIKHINYKPTTVIFFCHDDFPNNSIYISDSYCNVLKEGKEANLFYKCIPESLQEDSKSEEPTDEYQEEEIGVLFGGRDREETITHFWNTGYDVNNNNAPGLENMPTVSTTITPIPTSSECTFND